MDRPTIFDGLTNRPMDDDEFAQWQSDQAAPTASVTPPPSDLERAVQAVVAAPDFATAKANLQALLKGPKQ